MLLVRVLIGSAGGRSSCSLIFEIDEDRSALNLAVDIDMVARFATNPLSRQSWLIILRFSLSAHFENFSSRLNRSNEEFSWDCWWNWDSDCWWCIVCSLNVRRADTLCILARIECIDTKPKRWNSLEKLVKMLNWRFATAFFFVCVENRPNHEMKNVYLTEQIKRSESK